MAFSIGSRHLPYAGGVTRRCPLNPRGGYAGRPQRYQYAVERDAFALYFSAFSVYFSACEVVIRNFCLHF